ncbi:hypothetical protein Btru_070493 [Bulinus truncatus]|nr:hypothetical protein Btru_070493 [Bulinus truncatus]
MMSPITENSSKDFDPKDDKKMGMMRSISADDSTNITNIDKNKNMVELKEPVFPFSLYDVFTDAIKKNPKKRQVSLFKSAVLIYQGAIITLKELFQHLCKVVEVYEKIECKLRTLQSYLTYIIVAERRRRKLHYSDYLPNYLNNSKFLLIFKKKYK